MRTSGLTIPTMIRVSPLRSQCRENRDKFRREAAWKTVAECLGNEFPQDQCRAKWLSLRAVHRKIVNQLQHTKSGQAASSAKPNWRFFQAMKFVVQADKKNKMASESNLVSDNILS